jgi:hypothetical protein
MVLAVWSVAFLSTTIAISVDDAAATQDKPGVCAKGRPDAPGQTYAAQ